MGGELRCVPPARWSRDWRTSWECWSGLAKAVLSCDGVRLHRGEFDDNITIISLQRRQREFNNRILNIDLSTREVTFSCLDERYLISKPGKDPDQHVIQF